MVILDIMVVMVIVIFVFIVVVVVILVVLVNYCVFPWSSFTVVGVKLQTCLILKAVSIEKRKVGQEN